MAEQASDSVFVRIADLSAKALAAGGGIKTTEFLAACSEVLQIVEKLGTGFVLVRSDVGGNIDRLRGRQESDPARFGLLSDIVLAEVAEGKEGGSSSATKGLLWLKRAMEFVVALLQRLHDDKDVTLSTAASETYTSTLYRYHGWVTSAAFTVALKLCPSREVFFDKIELPPGADLMQQLQAFLLAFGAALGAVQKFLLEHNLDDPTKV